MPRQRCVFLDTAHIVALTNQNDQWHAAAKRWSETIVSQKIDLITTDFILLEIANALSPIRSRGTAIHIVQTIQRNLSAEIVPASRQLFAAALDLYKSRADKDWGLTDCTSFVVMKDRGLDEALTVDRHFQQAGFKALLLEE
jgi:predicted nucleic acid-binding protein